MRESRVLAAVAVWAGAAYLALTWAVAAGLTVPLDDAVYQLFRPGGSWGSAQELLGNIVDGAQPLVSLAALGVVALATAVRRRSWRPVVLAALLGVPTVAVVVATKWAVDREDPAGGFVPHDGSYPSGHVALVLVCGAGIALVLRRPVPRLAWLAVVTAWALMSLSILVIGLHWVSDVLGGTLVAIGVLAGALLVLVPRAGPQPRSTATVPDVRDERSVTP